MLTFHEPKFFGLYKVISGGQCGTDRGGLEAAHALHVLTGGTAPKKFRTMLGPAPELGSKFGLVEHESPSYSLRTKKNIENSDGTLIIASNVLSPGTHLTIDLTRQLRKPLKVIIIERQSSWSCERAADVANWIIENRIYVLNVAGNRDLPGSFFHNTAASEFLTCVLLDLQQKGLLETGAVK